MNNDQRDSWTWDILTDHRISWASKGLLLFILHYEHIEELRLQDLIEHGTSRRGHLRRLMKELDEFGYFAHYAVHDEHGRFRWEWMAWWVSEWGDGPSR